MTEKQRKTSRKSSKISRRPWKIIRIALLWARRGGLVISLNEVQKGIIRKLRHSSRETPRGALVYGDHEFSFDETPMFHVKMHRPSSLRFKMPNIPCIKPHGVDSDYDVEFDASVLDSERYSNDGKGIMSCNNVSSSIDYRVGDDDQDQEEEKDDEEIDSRAEEFIAKFYQEMKLQRQISYLQYQEMIQRGS